MRGQGIYSHPDSEVRHSYPLATKAASLGSAFELLQRTLPYALARFGVLVGLSVATIVWVVALFGGYVWLASLGGGLSLLAYVWFLVLTVPFGWAWFIVGRYFLYLLKAGHIAVLTELITTGIIQNGNQTMFDYGKNTVKARFGEVNVLFALDALIDGVVRAFNRTLNWVSDLIPIPGLSTVTGVVTAVVRASTTYIDETIFSYNLARGDENVWRSSQDALVYYAQNSRTVLETGLWVVVLDKVLTVVAWVVCLLPGFAFAWILPQSVTFGGLLPLGIAVLFAANFRSAFLEPLFLTLVMIKFHHAVQNQPIHQEWCDKLDSVSDKFQELGKKARAFGSPSSVRPPANATVVSA